MISFGAVFAGTSLTLSVGTRHFRQLLEPRPWNQGASSVLCRSRQEPWSRAEMQIQDPQVQASLGLRI